MEAAMLLRSMRSGPMPTLLMLTLTTATPAAAQNATAAFGPRQVQYPERHPADCTCRAAGQNIHVGETTCLATASGPRLAICDMQQNVTSWRFLTAPCPAS
jgi:hypothetical protein